MTSVSDSTWQCPSCRQALVLNANTWRCDNNHSFDRAKEGYVNLLLSQHRNSKAPGDNKEMVLARQSFLQQGYYQPLADKISAVTADFFASLASVALFDAGCGEGYYTEQLLGALIDNNVSVAFSGVDISKPAIQKAAKRGHDIRFAVASTFQIPLADQSQDAVLQVFAPSQSEEIHRILKNECIWITVNPAEEHLFELKNLVYDNPEKHKVETKIPKGFNQHSEFRLSFEIALDDPHQRKNLLMMTPFYWSISENKKEQVMQNLSKVRTDFVISILQKKRL